MTPFLGFGPGAIRWFEGLLRDNSKAYFEAHRDLWEAEVRGPMAALLDEVAAARGGRVKMFRPHRDVRFSKDKSPYKTSAYGVVLPETGAAGLYAAISAEGFYAATGYYGMAPDQVSRFRDAAAGDAGPTLAEAVAAAEAEGLEVWGAAVKTAPRGYDKTHPNIRFIRMKEVVLGARLGQTATLDGRAPMDHALRVWEAARPATDWLDAHVGPSQVPPDDPFGRR